MCVWTCMCPVCLECVCMCVQCTVQWTASPSTSLLLQMTSTCTDSWRHLMAVGVKWVYATLCSWLSANLILMQIKDRARSVCHSYGDIFRGEKLYQRNPFRFIFSKCIKALLQKDLFIYSMIIFYWFIISKVWFYCTNTFICSKSSPIAWPGLDRSSQGFCRFALQS